MTTSNRSIAWHAPRACPQEHVQKDVHAHNTAYAGMHPMRRVHARRSMQISGCMPTTQHAGVHTIRRVHAHRSMCGGGCWPPGPCGPMSAWRAA